MSNADKTALVLIQGGEPARAGVWSYSACIEDGLKVGSMPAGARGVDTEAQVSSKANWISHNYTHLMEQPTVFYPVVIMLALMGDNSALSLNLAWGYAGVRVLHSLWQANVNMIRVRFALFALSSLCLITLAARAVMQAV